MRTKGEKRAWQEGFDKGIEVGYQLGYHYGQIEAKNRLLVKPKVIREAEEILITKLEMGG